MEEKKTRKKNRTSTLLIVFLVLLGVVLLAVIGVFIFFNHYYQKTNFVEDAESIEYAPTEPADYETMSAEDEKALAEKLARERQEAIARVIERYGTQGETEEEDETPKYKGNVYQLMLIGVDRRTKTWNGNSDAMILVSVNYDKKKIVLTSFMRDTAVNIPGVGIRKMNAAFAVGNGPLLMQTMAVNFGITVDNYAWVDFDDMQHIIDSLGGVDITLTQAEGRYIGVAVEGASATVHLNGAKALAYARDRTTSGWDYGRTQRQRNVIMAIVNKAKSGGIGNLTSAASAVLPYITHNISETKLMSLLLDLPKLISYDFIEQRVPFDGMYHNEGEFLVPDFDATITRLFESMY
ncbi:MAG: LCP family protein [Lachnospiraceae bacterium]|nr:LCP family protein [Lachnospiraceae bacterium]